MASLFRPVLPHLLATELAALGTGLNDGKLEDALAGLSVLPSNLAVRASQKIARTARLGWWQLETGHSQARLVNRSAEQRLLRRSPKYAWLFLFHPDGYIREAALDAINGAPTSPFFVSALAWRLNDWVPPVRRAAKRCAERVLPEVRADVAAKAALYLLDRSLVWSRWSDEFDVLDSMFERKDVIEALTVLLEKQSVGPLATCFRNILRHPNADEYLPRLAGGAVQPSVRALAYQCLIAGKATWTVGFEWTWVDKVYGLRKRIPTVETRDIRRTRLAADLIRIAARDRSAVVRKVAADALIAARSQLPDEEALITRLAKDRSPAVRSRADFMLRHPPRAQS
jgi:hypothetical protein